MNAVKKQYTGIVRDHSGSMNRHALAAMQDYNGLINTIRLESDAHDIDTIVSVIKCGFEYDGTNTRDFVNSSVNRLKPLTVYPTDGSYTPLFDAVGEMIDVLEASAKLNQDETNAAFLVQVVTDGADNHSTKWSGRMIGDRIVRLQGKDNWTFVFRVPLGEKRNLVRFGIPEGNIIEWNTRDTKDYVRTSRLTQEATSNYYGKLAAGVRGTDSFYANLGGVTKSQVKSVLTNISSEVRVWTVTTADVGPRGLRVPPKVEISIFVENHTRQPYVRGTAFYELVKSEKAVQSNKLFVIRSKKDGAVYSGQSARDLLELPTTGTVKLAPGDHGDWEIFVQSRSSNRILPVGTRVLYWPNAR